MNSIYRAAVMTAVALSALVAVGASAAEVTTVIRTQDYDGNTYNSPSYGFTGSVVNAVEASVQGYAGLGVGSDVFSGNLLFDSAPLGDSGVGGTFTNLPVGGTISFSFLLATIDGWGGASQAHGGPDLFQLLTNNTLYYDTAISNFNATSTNGGVLLGAANYGGNPAVTDTAWDFTDVAQLQNIHYSGTTFSFAFRAAGAGWTGGPHESWGIDNFQVSLTAPVASIPEPETYAMLLAGLAGIGFVARKRRAAR